MKLLVGTYGHRTPNNGFELPKHAAAFVLQRPCDFRIDPKHQAVAVELRTFITSVRMS